MLYQSEEQTGRWFIYIVTVTLGIVFSIILLNIAWNNSLDRSKRDFTLQSVSLKESVNQNLRSAHDSTNNLASFFLANPKNTRKQFEIIVNGLLERHPFIDGAFYSPLNNNALLKKLAEGNSDNKSQLTSGVQGLPIRYQIAREPVRKTFVADFVHGDKDFRDVFNSMLLSSEVVAATSSNADTVKNYWMFKVLREEPATDPGSHDTGMDKIHGLIAVLVNTKKLLGPNVMHSNLSITMFNNSARINGRQVLYNTMMGSPVADAWTVASLNEEAMTQFPLYSIKLSIGKDVAWREVEKNSVYIALIIGIGVTLLLIALVRAKDLQARELRERNIVIEHKVEEQTKELALTRDQALNASKVKSEFLASMSHEIRTPLNAIIGMSELLSETRLTREQKNYTDVFRKAGDTLLNLVNDILDLSKIEAKQLILEKINFDLISVMEDSIELYAMKSAEKNIELLVDVGVDLYPSRMGDPARLRQIIINLVSNALKFTESGEIVVHVEQDHESNNENILHFCVSDTGIGIPKDKLEAIFASFTQADSSTTRKYGGTGLGLTICRSLVALMHGKIWVESEEGTGSTFHFQVDLERAEAMQTSGGYTDSWLKGRHMLVVDDNASNRRILTRTLAAWGAIIDEAADGEAALAKINYHIQDNNPHDVILIDCHMPDMNGFQFVKSIREKGCELKTIMMLNSADINTYITEAKDLKVQGYLIKPVKRSDLVKHIGEVLYDARVDHDVMEDDDTEPDTQKIQSSKILLVDDNPDNRLLIRAYLKQLPYILDEAENGKIAVEKFKQSDYAMVLMDVQMPIMDGHQATATMRDWEKQTGKRTTPIIALTAHAIKEEIDKCMDAGCNTHLSKPVKKAILIQTIQSYTR